VEITVSEQPIYKVGKDVSPRSPQFDPDPPYSERARIVKYSGTVAPLVVIDAQGNVSDISVLKPLFFGLAEQALETVRTWKFRRARRGFGSGQSQRRSKLQAL